MKKVAILTKGNEPFPEEDSVKFYKSLNRDLGIVEGLLKDKGYDVYWSSLDEAAKDISLKSGDDIMFYYSGHGREFFSDAARVQGIFDSVGLYNGNKNIILDACSGEKPLEYNLPNDSRVVYADEVAPSKAMSMLMWDLNARGKNLEKLTNEDFSEIKQNWVKVLNK